MEYRLSPTRPQLFRLEIHRATDKSAYRHMRFFQVRSGIYRPMLSIPLAVQPQSLQKIPEPFQVEQQPGSILLSPEQISIMQSPLCSLRSVRAKTQRYKCSFTQGK